MSLPSQGGLSQDRPPPALLPYNRFEPMTLSRRIVILVGISLVFLLAIFLWPPAPVAQRLAQAHLRPYRGPAVEERGPAPPPDFFTQGLTAYDSRAYPQAIARLEAYLALPAASTPRQVQARLYLGVSYLLAGQPAQAVPPLTAVLTQPQTGYQDDARWYLAWAYLQQAQRTEAVELFSLLAQQTSPYQAAAAEVWAALRTADER